MACERCKDRCLEELLQLSEESALTPSQMYLLNSPSFRAMFDYIISKDKDEQKFIRPKEIAKAIDKEERIVRFWASRGEFSNLFTSRFGIDMDSETFQKYKQGELKEEETVKAVRYYAAAPEAKEICQKFEDIKDEYSKIIDAYGFENVQAATTDYEFKDAETY